VTLKLVGPSASAESIYKMAGKLALRGGYISPSEYHLPRRPYCDAPVLVGRRTDPRDIGPTIEASMWVPCRKCNKCLQFRRLQWRERMEIETIRAKRTWFVTLTFCPVVLAGILAEAHLRSDARSFDRAVDDCAYKHVQRYLKRLRKEAPPFRYVFVFERGEQTGRPHYHGLIHEGGLECVTYRQITSNWPSHTHAKLVSNSGALVGTRYVSKYLGKSLDTRPRASLSYGAKQID